MGNKIWAAVTLIPTKWSTRPLRQTIAQLEAKVAELQQNIEQSRKSVIELCDQNTTLAAANQDLEQQVIRQQDRIDAVTLDREKLYDMLNVALVEERKAYQMHINAAWQAKGGTVPYPTAPHLPNNPNIEQEGGPAGQPVHVLRSQLTARAAKDFARTLVESRNKR